MRDLRHLEKTVTCTAAQLVDSQVRHLTDVDHRLFFTPKNAGDRSIFSGNWPGHEKNVAIIAIFSDRVGRSQFLDIAVHAVFVKIVPLKRGRWNDVDAALTQLLRKKAIAGEDLQYTSPIDPLDQFIKELILEISPRIFLHRCYPLRLLVLSSKTNRPRCK